MAQANGRFDNHSISKFRGFHVKISKMATGENVLSDTVSEWELLVVHVEAIGYCPNSQYYPNIVFIPITCFLLYV